MLSKSQIKLIKSLSIKKYRDEEALFVAEGEKLVSELINSPFKIKHLYTTANSKTANITTNDSTNGMANRTTEIISVVEMEKISGLKTASTALALVEIPKHTLNISDLKDELVLALDNVQDPGNVGTIIRIADWFGIRHIICSPHTADCYSPKTIQATMGAITRVQIHYTDLLPVLTTCQQQGMPVYGTFLNGENIYKDDLSKNGIIVMGSEGQGISPEVEKLITRRITIPPYSAGNTSESLNVAVATAIVCSEFRRK